MHSRTSEADDYVEEHKLLGQDSERVKYLSLGQLDTDEVNGEVSGNSEETIAHLRECIKTEREQKVSYKHVTHLKLCTFPSLSTASPYEGETEKKREEPCTLIFQFA